MKGMQKIKRGKSFAGVVQYALKPGAHHKSDPIIIGGNMLGDSALELIAEFDSTKHLRQDVAKSVWHNSLRLPNGESLTNEQWSSIADDYMKRMGFSDTHLRCYVLHDDEGQHIHIIASRIDIAGGKLYLGRNENLISTRIISELEITHNLTVTMTAPKQPKRRKVSRNEQMLSERTGLPSPKEALQQILDKSLADTPDLLTFTKRLEEAEVSWTANIASTGKMNGFSFSYRDIAFKASQLGKSYSWANLSNRLNYNPGHLEALRIDIPAKEVSQAPMPIPAPAPAPAPASASASASATILETREQKESISEKIAELELRLKKDRRNEIVEKILQKNAVNQQKHLRLIGWLPFLRRLAELLRSYGKSILHKTHTHFSKIHVIQPLNKARKIRL
ncbi:TPA: relaxase/mobilization nuclease domain-containing protein [Klebsiella pneumoniae]|nr:relaxase/mobilization nuclease domain-containing protein [Klebsiella pneumoniae]